MGGLWHTEGPNAEIRAGSDNVVEFDQIKTGIWSRFRDFFYVGKRRSNNDNNNNVDDGDDDDNNGNDNDNDDDDDVDDDGDGCWETEVVKLGVGNSKTMLSFPVR